MPPMKGQPLGDLTSLQDKMNRIFAESVKRLKEISETKDEKSFSPPVDIYEFEDNYLLLAELPGVPKETLSVEVNGNALTISGERPPDLASKEGSLLHNERYYGPFERVFNLPVNASSDGIQARLEDGVLKVTINKPEQPDRTVKVTVE